MTNDGGEAYSMGMQNPCDEHDNDETVTVSLPKPDVTIWLPRSATTTTVGELEGDSPTGFVITSTPEEQ